MIEEEDEEETADETMMNNNVITYVDEKNGRVNKEEDNVDETEGKKSVSFVGFVERIHIEEDNDTDSQRRDSTAQSDAGHVADVSDAENEEDANNKETDKDLSTSL